MSDVKNWKITAAGNSSASPDGFPEGMARSGVNNSSREVMAAIKRFYNAPDFRNPFVSFTLTRTSGTQWIFTNAGGETNAAQYMEVGQRIKAVITTNPTVDFWEGFVTAVAYGSPQTSFTVEWIAAVSKDTTGPTTATNCEFTVSFRELGTAAWYDVGTSAGTLPLYETIKTYAVSTDEGDLDVGAVQGQSALQLMTAGARARLNCNGGFNVWQRGIQFTAATQFPNNADAVFADNWTLLSPINDAADIDRSTDVPVGVGVSHSAQFTVATANQKHAAITFAEFDDAADVARPGSSNRVSASLWVKQGAVTGVTTLKAYLVNLKTLAPSNTPINVWTTGAIGFNAIDWEVISTTTIDLATIGTTYTEVKIENVNMGSGTGAGAVALVVAIDQATVAAGAIWHLAAVQINRGTVALPYLPDSLAVEHLRCQRYYESCFDWQAGVYPDDGQGLSHSITARTAGTGTAIALATWRFRVPKFKTPTVVVYNPRAGGIAARWVNFSGGSELTNTATATREQVQLESAAGVAATTYYIALGVSANIWGTG